MQYTSFAEESPSFAEYFFRGRLGHRVFSGCSVAVFTTLMQYIHAILSFMLGNLLELTYLQKDTYFSSSCPGGYYEKQTVEIGSATNATKEAVVTRTILANLTYAQKEIATNGQHAIPALFSIMSQLTNTCQPCQSSCGLGPQRSKTLVLK
jgi:hypothetical protein